MTFDASCHEPELTFGAKKYLLTRQIQSALRGRAAAALFLLHVRQRITTPGGARQTTLPTWVKLVSVRRFGAAVVKMNFTLRGNAVDDLSPRAKRVRLWPTLIVLVVVLVLLVILLS